MNQKQGHGYRKQWLTSVPELSQQKEQCASVRAHGSSQSQEPTEFTSINKNLRNQALLSPTRGSTSWYQPSWRTIGKYISKALKKRYIWIP